MAVFFAGILMLGLPAQLVGSVSGSVISSEVQADGETVTDLGRNHGWAAAPRSTRVSASAEVRFPVTTVEKTPERMVVIGDVHGDFGAFEEIMRVAGLIDENGHWAGGETVLVQAGDIFDRGDADLEVEEWLWTLQQQAASSGGAVYHLLGNHEIMNAMGDHSSASRESFKPFQGLDVSPELKALGSQLDAIPEWARPRVAAMAPQGPVAKMLASHSVAMKVGDSLFVHGGLRPANLDPSRCGGVGGLACLENINRWTHEWLMGRRRMPADLLWGRESPIWTRYFGMPPGEELGKDAEKELQQVLDATGTVRMIIGHTPQMAGINSALGGRLWRTDTGMTAIIGGRPEALEIVGGVATVLTVQGRVPGEQRACRAGETLPPLPRLTEAERRRRRAGARVTPAAIATAATAAAAAAA